MKKFIKKILSRNAINSLQKIRAVLISLKYGSPAKKMIPIGITGTKGKTTTAFLISSILEEAGYKVGRISTVDYKVDSKITINEENMTVPDPSLVQPWLKKMVEAKCRYLVMEVTSHAIDQYRVWGIPYKVALLTNVTHDHLDYHKTFANYRDTKVKLFRWPSLKISIINADDKSAEYFYKNLKTKKNYFYSTNGNFEISQGETVVASKIFLSPTALKFTIKSESEEVEINLNLPGMFNVENALAAACVGLSQNIRLGTIKAGLENVMQVPGRMERIETKKGFTVIVDYAHTPDSLEKVYQTLEPIVRGRLISILGACGDRDKTKRPIMGALAARFADFVLVTDEESYTEDPQEIIDEVAAGVPRGRALFKKKSGDKPKRKPLEHKIHDVKEFMKKDESTGEGQWWWRVSDRRNAIRQALKLAKFDDLVLITGMGAQTYKVVGDKHLPWNDRQVVEEELANL